MFILGKFIMYLVIGHILYTHNISPNNKHIVDFITFMSSVLLIDILSYFGAKYSDKPSEEE